MSARKISPAVGSSQGVRVAAAVQSESVRGEKERKW